jgi:GST-like protein
VPYKNQGQNLDTFPHLRRWFERMKARPAVRRGLELGQDLRKSLDLKSDAKARKILFGQKAR